ncbi:MULTISPECIES: type II secretion system minor pseudopilin GspK [Photobacterium]|jgi:general secretion pathway protein K|uniref:Type II secretion system protein K n=1 Tax=Photobacterium iliopiscarium TaxID=56192 RepID=A0A0D8P3Q5_9GAMM|nr:MULTISPECIES: type II secretion system minor pseudopilin GspK [Photobacterium]KAE8176282.1 general secretion pathway protein GspK [Photobacterium carnosum]KJG13290.1 general secretion pathway protein GspK [Photobacterium iliopiscarium]KJG22838.1 general secretion pathway protein GspK [Photobacterium iliopiscarium]MCD9495816.1 general secretion pathway protein GspK [Photobacterium carnosum]MCD9530814.1 general secretion pathway protein GspK [Photobacterium carnosum]
MIKQRGVALIVVLLLVALMSLLAVQMTERLQLNFHRVQNQVEHQQSYWYSLGIEALASQALKQSLKDSKTVNLTQAWAVGEQSYPLDSNAVISGNLTDKQTCFNLNAFKNIKAGAGSSKQPFLVTYLQNILTESGVDDYEAEVIADSSWEFVDDNTTVESAYGAEDSTYESFQPPYVTANDWLADGSEFRAINGVSDKIYQQVKGLICALPTDDMLLNVNTITEKNAVLLSALFAPSLSLQDAQKIIIERDKKHTVWDSVADFMKLVPQPPTQDADSGKDKTTNTMEKYLTVTSHYFSLDAEIKVDRARVRAVALFNRDDKNKVTVVRRQYGGIRERISDDKAK